PALVCPSDGVARGGSVSKNAASSFAGNFGTGVQRDGYNGMFRHLETTFPQFPEGPVRAEDVADGLSRTAAMCEVLVGDGSGACRVYCSKHRRRNVACARLACRARWPGTVSIRNIGVLK